MSKKKNKNKNIKNSNRNVKPERAETIQNSSSDKKLWLRIVMLLIACAILIGIIATPVMGLYGYL